jgi:hypothetical protein
MINTEAEEFQEALRRRLSRVGVTLKSMSPFALECDDCQTVWYPDTRPGGGTSRGWWRCIKGCNKEVARLPR